MRKLLLVLPLLAACASSADGPPTEVLAVYAGTPPTIDGGDDDAAWGLAEELPVTLTYEQSYVHGTVRALVGGEWIYLLVRWRDTTEDREHKVWTPKPGGGFVVGPEREDVLAVGFPISGEFTGDMTSPVECVWDVWQWKSARTDPAGHAMDKSHVHSFTDPGGKRHVHDLPDGRKLHIARPEDSGTSATKTIAAPETGAARTPQYEAQEASGSAGDVLAKGVWKDGWWTVEMARKLGTGNADDLDFRGLGTVPFALAVLDHAEDEHHAASPVLTLRLR
jgi:Ethylbenzene dehydrogenase